MLSSIPAENLNRHRPNASQKYYCLRQQARLKESYQDEIWELRCEDVKWMQLACVKQRTLVLAVLNHAGVPPQYSI
jgi:hypothetical protein